MCKLGPLVAERIADKDLSRRVGEMLLGADDVGDLEVLVVHDSRQMVEACPIGPLDDVVLFCGPVKLDLTANQIL